MSILYC
jgi:hypothetical protein